MTTPRPEDDPSLEETNATTETEKNAARVFLDRLGREDSDTIAEWKSNEDPQQALIDLVKKAQGAGSPQVAESSEVDTSQKTFRELVEYAGSEMPMRRAIEIACLIASDPRHEIAFKLVRSKVRSNDLAHISAITDSTATEAEKIATEKPPKK